MVNPKGQGHKGRYGHQVATNKPGCYLGNTLPGRGCQVFFVRRHQVKINSTINDITKKEVTN